MKGDPGYSQPKHLLLGQILRPHGIRGEMRMRILTDYPERIKKSVRVFMGSGPDASDLQAYTVEHMRLHQAYGLLKLENVNDRGQADLYRDLFVMVPLSEAVPLEDDEVYLYQLIGMSVCTTDGVELGVVDDVLETGANDVYVVKTPAGAEILIPVIDQTIVETDVDTGVITVDLPEGLLPT